MVQFRPLFLELRHFDKYDTRHVSLIGRHVNFGPIQAIFLKLSWSQHKVARICQRIGQRSSASINRNRSFRRGISNLVTPSLTVAELFQKEFYERKIETKRERGQKHRAKQNVPPPPPPPPPIVGDTPLRLQTHERTQWSGSCRLRMAPTWWTLWGEVKKIFSYILEFVLYSSCGSEVHNDGTTPVPTLRSSSSTTPWSPRQPSRESFPEHSDKSTYA